MPGRCSVEDPPEIRRQKDAPAVLPYSLEQVVDLGVGITIVPIVHLRTLPEQRVRLVGERGGSYYSTCQEFKLMPFAK